MQACSLSMVLIDISTFSERLRLSCEARQIAYMQLVTLLEVDPRVYNCRERGAATSQFATMVHIADIFM